MPKTIVKHGRRSLADELKMQAQNQNPAPSLLASKKDKTYTKKQLDEINVLRRLRYNVLLSSARNDDMTAAIVFPTADQFEIPLSRVSRSIEARVELLDIYHYLKKRKENMHPSFKLTRRNFGLAVGIKLPKTTFYKMLKREDELRTAATVLPKGAHYIVKQKRKDMLLEQVMLNWLHDQRKKNVPVSGKLMKDAGHFACTVLCDLRDESGGTESKIPLSFSAWWLDRFKKRYHISHCRLHGEAGEVDLEAIEPELVEIHQLCAQYTPDNIFNCDETGMYVKELDTKSYTTSLSVSGAKAIRDCRVSILFCVNASGTSLAMAKKKKSLRPLVIGEHIPRDVEKEAAAKMTMRRTHKGWMDGEVFVRWLQKLDDDLDQPTLLLMDSAGSHNNVDMRDPFGGVPWKHLRIRRLPVNSTSVTQPLDAGVISAFKRVFLEMLGFETYYARNFDQTVTITNGHAWSLVPHAWDQMKPSTVRNCFAKTPVLPTQMRDHLQQQRPTKEEQQQPTPRYTQHEAYKEQEKAYFERIVAEIGVKNELNFRLEESREELVGSALQQVDMDRGGQDLVGGGGEASSYNSSPLSDTDINTTIQTLQDLAGDSDVLTTDGLKRARWRAQHNSEEGQEIGKIVKQFVRDCAAVRNRALHKDVANGHK